MKIKRKIGLKGAVQLEVKHTVNSPKVFILESSRILTAFSRLIFLPVFLMCSRSQHYQVLISLSLLETSGKDFDDTTRDTSWVIL